jgi:hypothetical protein
VSAVSGNALLRAACVVRGRSGADDGSQSPIARPMSYFDIAFTPSVKAVQDS